jgi:DNA polymerase III subunit epsilon
MKLAFVDIETTGLCPRTDRITEIGVIAVDGSRKKEWVTLLNPRSRISARSRFWNGIDDAIVSSAPRFSDIAGFLAKLLADRLVIAHNARFDYSFLRAEFERVGIDFNPRVLCSVMLSRKLYPHYSGHDLDALAERHGLRSEIRHRALPDAQLIWQFWQAAHREHPAALIGDTIDKLLAGPVLPPHLDPGLIDRLPETPGVYVLHGESRPLHVGRASNLKLHVQNYFRIDRTSAKAMAISHLIRDITWHIMQGELGARLLKCSMARTLLAGTSCRLGDACSWRFNPDSQPAVELTSLSDRSAASMTLFGIFHSERKARSALSRLAAKNGLCHALLGISPATEQTCGGCTGDGRRAGCGRRAERLAHLTRAYVALLPLRVPPWPYPSPIAIRERAELHIVDNWRYLGTARNDPEVHSILQTRPGDFDENIFAVLAKQLHRLPRSRIVHLPRHPEDRDQ